MAGRRWLVACACLLKPIIDRMLLSIKSFRLVYDFRLENKIIRLVTGYLILEMRRKGERELINDDDDDNNSLALLNVHIFTVCRLSSVVVCHHQIVHFDGLKLLPSSVEVPVVEVVVILSQPKAVSKSFEFRMEPIRLSSTMSSAP